MIANRRNYGQHGVHDNALHRRLSATALAKLPTGFCAGVEHCGIA
jgi:hypothetical protein